MHLRSPCPFAWALALALAFGLPGGGSASGQVPHPIVPPDHPGPWDGDIILLESEDGMHFERKGTLVKGGGVSSLILDKEGRLVAAFQWFPADRPEAFDRVAVSISADDGKTWTPPEPITVEGLPADYRRPFDPTLVEIPDGRCRLYFTSHSGKDRAGPGFGAGELPGIYSAISDDAVHYRFEPGARFRVEGEMVIDCAAARLGDEHHLIVPVQKVQGKAYHAVSRDGLEFTRLADLELDVRGSWLGCALAVEGGLRFFGTGAGGWSATSADGRTWRLDGEPRGKGAPRYAGADPGVARSRSGRYVMVATGRLGREGRPAGEPGQPPADGRRPAPPAGISANQHSVYVLRDGTLYRFDAITLELEASVRLPREGPVHAGQDAGQDEGGQRPRPPRADGPRPGRE